jgi:hypothetical protein
MTNYMTSFRGLDGLIASSLTQRSRIGARLAKVVFLVIVVVLEQLKTRFEVVVVEHGDRPAG